MELNMMNVLFGIKCFILMSQSYDSVSLRPMAITGRGVAPIRLRMVEYKSET